MRRQFPYSSDDDEDEGEGGDAAVAWQAALAMYAEGEYADNEDAADASDNNSDGDNDDSGGNVQAIRRRICIPGLVESTVPAIMWRDASIRIPWSKPAVDAIDVDKIKRYADDVVRNLGIRNLQQFMQQITTDHMESLAEMEQKYAQRIAEMQDGSETEAAAMREHELLQAGMHGVDRASQLLLLLLVLRGLGLDKANYVLRPGTCMVVGGNPAEDYTIRTGTQRSRGAGRGQELISYIATLVATLGQRATVNLRRQEKLLDAGNSRRCSAAQIKSSINSDNMPQGAFALLNVMLWRPLAPLSRVANGTEYLETMATMVSGMPEAAGDRGTVRTRVVQSALDNVRNGLSQLRQELFGGSSSRERRAMELYLNIMTMTSHQVIQRYGSGADVAKYHDTEDMVDEMKEMIEGINETMRRSTYCSDVSNSMVHGQSVIDPALRLNMQRTSLLHRFNLSAASVGAMDGAAMRALLVAGNTDLELMRALVGTTTSTEQMYPNLTGSGVRTTHQRLSLPTLFSLYMPHTVQTSYGGDVYNMRGDALSENAMLLMAAQRTVHAYGTAQDMSSMNINSLLDSNAWSDTFVHTVRAMTNQDVSQAIVSDDFVPEGDQMRKMVPRDNFSSLLALYGPTGVTAEHLALLEQVLSPRLNDTSRPLFDAYVEYLIGAEAIVRANVERVMSYYQQHAESAGSSHEILWTHVVGSEVLQPRSLGTLVGMVPEVTFAVVRDAVDTRGNATLYDLAMLGLPTFREQDPLSYGLRMRMAMRTRQGREMDELMGTLDRELSIHRMAMYLNYRQSQTAHDPSRRADLREIGLNVGPMANDLHANLAVVQGEQYDGDQNMLWHRPTAAQLVRSTGDANAPTMMRAVRYARRMLQQREQQLRADLRLARQQVEAQLRRKEELRNETYFSYMMNPNPDNNAATEHEEEEEEERRLPRWVRGKAPAPMPFEEWVISVKQRGDAMSDTIARLEKNVGILIGRLAKYRTSSQWYQEELMLLARDNYRTLVAQYREAVLAATLGIEMYTLMSSEQEVAGVKRDIQITAANKPAFIAAMQRLRDMHRIATQRSLGTLHQYSAPEWVMPDRVMVQDAQHPGVTPQMMYPLDHVNLLSRDMERFRLSQQYPEQTLEEYERMVWKMRRDAELAFQPPPEVPPPPVQPPAYEPIATIDAVLASNNPNGEQPSDVYRRLMDGQPLCADDASIEAHDKQLHAFMREVGRRHTDAARNGRADLHDGEPDPVAWATATRTNHIGCCSHVTLEDVLLEQTMQRAHRRVHPKLVPVDRMNFEEGAGMTRDRIQLGGIPGSRLGVDSDDEHATCTEIRHMVAPGMVCGVCTRSSALLVLQWIVWTLTGLRGREVVTLKPDNPRYDAVAAAYMDFVVASHTPTALRVHLCSQCSADGGRYSRKDATVRFARMMDRARRGFEATVASALMLEPEGSSRTQTDPEVQFAASNLALMEQLPADMAIALGLGFDPDDLHETHTDVVLDQNTIYDIKESMVEQAMTRVPWDLVSMNSVIERCMTDPNPNNMIFTDGSILERLARNGLLPPKIERHLCVLARAQTYGGNALGPNEDTGARIDGTAVNRFPLIELDLFHPEYANEIQDNQWNTEAPDPYMGQNASLRRMFQ